jgi:hypothetical protein
VGHGVIFVKQLADKEHLHALQGSGVLRASINVAQGAVDGLGFVVTNREDVTSTRQLSLACPEGSPVPCDLYWIENILPSILSHSEPLALLAFLALEIEQGCRRPWQTELEKLASDVEADDYLAAAHLFGPGRYNALVEVTSNSRQRFHRLLLGASDIPGVRVAHLLRVDGRDTRGMGTTGT